MPGGTNDELIRSFHRALGLQSLVVLGLAIAVVVVWQRQRSALIHTGGAAALTTAGGTAHAGTARRAALNATYHEAPARRILRLGFGALWLFDGLLQLQTSMPGGLATGVLRPSSHGSPGWVGWLVDNASQVWIDHPAAMAAAVVWVQVGIGAWMLVARSGRLLQMGALAGVVWGLIVWVAGESFAGIFAPGSSLLVGTPGALLYVIGGALVAMPERFWSTPRPGRAMLRVGGAFLVGMAVLQAWPGRGYWGGNLGGSISDMASMAQPVLLHDVVAASASFVSAHGFAVNLFAVLAMLGIGVAIFTCRPAVVRVGVAAAVVLGLVAWVLVQDLAIVGGLGTDPGNLLPFLLLLVAGYLALARPTGPAIPGSTPAAIAPSEKLRTAAAVACGAVVMLGAVPMLVAAA